MEAILVSLIIFLATLLNEIPLIIGLLKQKGGVEFLGVIHHPQDYFYYLSQFAQGQNHWFLGYDLLTGDYQKLTPVGWPNIFLGKLFWLIGIDHLYAYQASVIIFTLLFLFLCYQLLGKIFADRKLRIFAFFLFVFTNGLPLVNRDTGGFHLSTIDFWFNLGNPLTRLGGVPHQLLANCTILIIFLSSLKFREKHAKLTLIIFALFTFILASVNPVQWVVVGVVLFLVLIPEILKSPAFSQKLRSMLPLFLIFLAGFPIALYLKILFSGLPYRQLADWETAQLVIPTIPQFIAAYGVVGILGAVGMLLIFKVTKPAGRILIFYGIISFLPYFSPSVALVHLTNARFISGISVLALAASATIFLKLIGDKLNITRLMFLLVSVIILLLFIPVFYFEAKDKTSYFTLDNAYFYLPKEELAVFAKAREVSTEKDLFLVFWPFNDTFAGLTGRREYNGHPLLTINAAKKDALAQQFFSGKPDWQLKFLHENRINYVITYPLAFQLARPFLHEVYANPSLTLYKVW